VAQGHNNHQERPERAVGRFILPPGFGYDLLLARDLRSLQPDELSQYVRDRVT
jgi:hypothetical protein